MKFTAISKIRTYAMVFALIAIWLIFAQITDGIFLTSRNLSNLLRQASVTAILSIGMVFVIVSGNIDLSVGFGSGLLGAIVAILHAERNFSPISSILIAMMVGGAIGTLHGFLIAYQKIPAFIVTLGGFLVYRGLMLEITDGKTIMLPNTWIKQIGNGYLTKSIGWIIAIAVIFGTIFVFWRQRIAREKHGFEIPSFWIFVIQMIGSILLISIFVGIMNAHEGVAIPVCILLILAMIFNFIAIRTRFGRYVYAIGGNAEAAYLSGVNVKKNALIVYVLMGILMSIAGIILTARVGSASPEAGRLLELDAIAACVIGGSSLMGGRGTIPGAMIGALLMESLNNGMSMANMGSAWQDIIKGTVLTVAVWFDIFSHNKK